MTFTKQVQFNWYIKVRVKVVGGLQVLVEIIKVQKKGKRQISIGKFPSMLCSQTLCSVIVTDQVSPH